MEARQQVGSRRLQLALSSVDIYSGEQLHHGAIVMLAADSLFRLAARNRLVKGVHFHFAINPYSQTFL